MATQLATLGGGCFWCTEAVFLDLRGVTKVVSGYAGGTTQAPTYRQVCAGTTGHAECVQVTFDDAEVSYADVLRVFFTTHDPTTKNRQGADAGTQYRSVVFTSDDAQAATARAVVAEIEAERMYPAPLVTEIVPLPHFWPAEAEHQDYFNRNPFAGYCRAVVAPKVAKFRKLFSDRLKRPLAA